MANEEYANNVQRHFLAAFLDFPEFLGAYVLSKLHKDRIEDWHMILTNRKKWGVRSAVAEKVGGLIMLAIVIVILLIVDRFN